MSLATQRQEPPADPHQLIPRPRAKFLDLRPDSPFRPPDRRWQIGLLLNEATDVPPAWVDRWTLLAEELLSTDIGRAGSPPDLVAVATARDLYEKGPYWKQVEVEGRLLADEPVEVIAAKTVLTEATVEAYEALFYSVRDRLPHPGAVTQVVIGLHTESAEHDIGTHIRSLAYTAGPVVLDAMLDAVRGEGDCGEVSEEVRKKRKLGLINLRLRMTPITDRNRMQWFRLYALQKELKIRGW